MEGGWLVEVIMVGFVSGEERMSPSCIPLKAWCLW